MRLKEPLYLLSKKYYAGGEVTLEFLIINNKELTANMNLTLKDKLVADLFELGQNYEIEFKKKET